MHSANDDSHNNLYSGFKCKKWKGTYSNSKLDEISSIMRVMNIIPTDIKITVSHHHDLWNVRAVWHDACVGYARCILHGNRLCLSDIRVECAHQVRHPFVYRLLYFLRLPRTLNFRGRHVGSRIMKRIIEDAEAAGVSEIWGSISHFDIEKTPHLLQWYSRLRFSIEEPDDECIKGAAKKITMSMMKKGI